MISIIIPTYNRASIISSTLNSVSSQIYRDWECFVVDDNSLDNTEDVVNGYIRRDSRFHYIRNSRKKGAQGARNTGLYYCNSEWVVFFDSDNIMHDDFLKELSNKFSAGVDVVQCFSNVIEIDTRVRNGVFSWKSYGNIHEQLFNQETYVDFNHAAIRRRKLIEIGGLDERCPSMQEWDTHIRLSQIAHYTTVEKLLIDYYVGGADTISSDLRREVMGREYILRKHIVEWRQRKESYKEYIEQIEDLINKNEDYLFRKRASQQLHWIARDVYIERFIKLQKTKIRLLYYKLVPWKTR